MFATFRQPRWVTLAVIAVLLSVLFWWLGTWQWGRWEERSARNDRIDAALAAPPSPLAALMPDPASLAASKEYRTVTVTGTYQAQAQVLQRNPDGRSGYAVLTPLVIDDGGTLLVERGFVPANPTDAATPAEDVTPPSGPVEVTMRLRAPEVAADRAAPAGQVYDIVPADIAAGLPEPVYAAYGELVSEQPAASDALELPEPPSTGIGPNLFYAFQWWAFIVVALVGYVVLLRRESTDRSAAQEPVTSAAE